MDSKMAKWEEVDGFLMNLGKVDYGYYYYQRDKARNSRYVKSGFHDLGKTLEWMKGYFDHYDIEGPPIPGMDVGEAQNVTHDDIVKITQNFSQDNFIHRIPDCKFFRGFIPDGEGGKREVTVKTWDIEFYENIHNVKGYPQLLRNEMVLLARSELKTNPYLVKLIGFCYEKTLAVVYDLSFNKFLFNLLPSAEFGWKDRMKVAIQSALLVKTLNEKQFGVDFIASQDFMIDKDYNIKVVDFLVCAFPQTLGIYNSATVSDDPISFEQSAVNEIGYLLFELVTKERREGPPWGHPGDCIKRLNGISPVAESFKIDAGVSLKVTKLIQLCVSRNRDERPSIDSVYEDLVAIIWASSNCI